MSPEQMQALVTDWNERYPVGQSVTVEEDDGTESKTKTRSEAWLLGGHTAVVSLEDRAGGFMLTRITPR